MAAVTVTPANVKVLKPDEAEITIEVLGAAATAGNAVYVDFTTGKAHPADANGSDTENAVGILLADARTGANATFASGSTVNVLRRGLVGGFDLSGLTYNSTLHLSETAGAIDGTAATNVVRIGRVVGVWDQGDTAPDKYLFVDKNTPANL